jgi:hypothetical protein
MMQTFLKPNIRYGAFLRQHPKYCDMFVTKSKIFFPILKEQKGYHYIDMSKITENQSFRVILHTKTTMIYQKLFK